MAMKRAQGFTVLEAMAALGALTVVLTASWVLLARSRQHGRVLWDELCAEEWAVAILEEARAGPAPPVTPANGRNAALSGPLAERFSTTLPEAQAILHVRPAPACPGLLEIKVVVRWRRAVAPTAGGWAQVERVVWRRAEP
jgi:hypothetical protein